MVDTSPLRGTILVDGSLVVGSWESTNLEL